MRARVVALVAAAVGLLAGCYESPDVNLYEPGVYKGKSDPLLAKQRDTGQQKALSERFDLVQRDR